MFGAITATPHDDGLRLVSLEVSLPLLERTKRESQITPRIHGKLHRGGRGGMKHRRIIEFNDHPHRSDLATLRHHIFSDLPRDFSHPLIIIDERKVAEVCFRSREG